MYICAIISIYPQSNKQQKLTPNATICGFNIDVLNGVTNKSRSVTMIAIVPLMMPSVPMKEVRGEWEDFWVHRTLTINVTLGLVGIPAAGPSQGQGAVGQVQLVRPADPGGGAHRGGGGHVGVVGADRFAGGVPLEQDFLPGEG